MKQRIIYSIFLFISLLTLHACGINLEVYQWRKVDVRAINATNNIESGNDEGLSVSDYAIEVNLNPEPLVNVSSSDWINASSGYQANDQISSVEIITLVDFNERYGAGDDMTQEFDAGPVGATETERFPIQNYLTDFGFSSSTIDSTFVLFLNPIEITRSQPAQFQVTINLSNGGTFSSSTSSVLVLAE